MKTWKSRPRIQLVFRYKLICRSCLFSTRVLHHVYGDRRIQNFCSDYISWWDNLFFRMLKCIQIECILFRFMFWRIIFQKHQLSVYSVNGFKKIYQSMYRNRKIIFTNIKIHENTLYFFWLLFLTIIFQKYRLENNLKNDYLKVYSLKKVYFKACIQVRFYLLHASIMELLK